MKKILCLILTISICSTFTACGSSTKVETAKIKSATNVPTVLKKVEPTQKELNDKLKKEATKANFVELNGHATEHKNKRVFVEGEIGFISTTGWVGGEFSISTKEGKGYGMYEIYSLDSNENVVGEDIKEGDKVKVYGVVSPSESDKPTVIKNAPHITATKA